MIALVLGASGFIGSKLVSRLLQQGVHVRLVTRSDNLAYLSSNEQVEIIKMDLLDRTAPFDEIINGCNVIFNCAGELKNINRMRGLHVKVVQNMINACQRLSLKSNCSIHWVQLSSVGAYGKGDGRCRVVTEETVTNPHGEYEITKTDADKIIMSSEGSFTWSILRPSNVYGPGMPNNSLRQLAKIISKRLFFYIGFHRSIATYVHVDDVVSALILCASDQRAKNQVFNVSNDCYLDRVINAIASYYSVSIPRIRLPIPLVRCLVFIVSRVVSLPINQERINALVSRTRYPTSKIEAVLDFSPSKALDSNIEDIF
ncbi:NAD-dependent epimerase/dehydratase family protein [Pseudomonas segetis]|uniref:Nucleoside-diphosphate-sugar epimerase n=1 Tax=Pseudomonas segetis TaxID=298908 RepID=A0A239A4Z1_9PSED|nr:NAD-dependent epimerase/dehydratase family protein [Pseudomonas segetis]SNR90736.1 Nucleoside-diphosphate-sugar epimerase [Pseudomonas segetis]